MSLSTSDMITIVRQFARNAGDSSEYPDAQITTALQMAGDKWQRIVHGARAMIETDLTPGTSMADISGGGFLPEQVMAVFLTLAGKVIDPNLAFTSNQGMLESQFNGDRRTFPRFASPGGSLPTGQPKIVAFQDSGTAVFDTLVDQAYTLNIWRWSPFSASSPNLPDEHLLCIARWGGPAFLQFNEAKNSGSAQTCMTMLESEARKMAARNAGGLGGSVSLRSPVK